MLTSNGIVPNVIFYIDMYLEICYERVESLSNTEFMYDPRVFSQKLRMQFLRKFKSNYSLWIKV